VPQTEHVVVLNGNKSTGDDKHGSNYSAIQRRVFTARYELNIYSQFSSIFAYNLLILCTVGNQTDSQSDTKLRLQYTKREKAHLGY